MNTKLIGEIEHRENEKLFVHLRENKSKQWIDIRVFFPSVDGFGRYLPTKKGVTVPMDCLPALMQLLEQARLTQTVEG